jgi:hypothetical protein
MTRSELESELLPQATVGRTRWPAAFHREQAEGVDDGWFLPGALDLVRASGLHEVACHGFSHIPLEESMALTRHELASAVRIARRRGIVLRTLVYPRNRVAFTELLPEYGFWGYRSRLETLPGVLGRVAGLLRELNVGERAQTDARHPPATPPVPIPSGYFLNWRLGLRAAVPSAITIARWSTILTDAVRRGGVAHVWLHPHNLVSAPSTFEVLFGVIDAVCRLRDRGQVQVLTQSAYCRALMTDQVETVHAR